MGKTFLLVTDATVVNFLFENIDMFYVLKTIK